MSLLRYLPLALLFVWPLRAAQELKASGVKWPVQYERARD